MDGFDFQSFFVNAIIHCLLQQHVVRIISGAKEF